MPVSVLFYILSNFNFTKFCMHSWKIFKVPVDGKLNFYEMKCWSGKCAGTVNLCSICIMFIYDDFLPSTAFYPLYVRYCYENENVCLMHFVNQHITLFQA